MPASVQLQPEDERRVDRLVEQGRFASRDEVVHQAIASFARHQEWFADVEAKWQEAEAQVARGEVLTADEVFEPLLEDYRNWPR